MKSENPTPRSVGITVRTALLSWLITIATLLIFVMVIIPLQKRTFLENLESKAHGIAVSLRDVAATAAVNEDYSSVVDQCTAMMDGDKSIAYLIVTKTETGDSQIFQQESPRWHRETLGAEWRPQARQAANGIDAVPLFHRRVFHYSQPFDYQAIQWGWIHVGLTLDSYDSSVRTVYRRTGILAVCCILISLGISLLYAKRLVRPILDLQKIVTNVAGGDLSARARIQRGDELGSLADAVNQMTEALLRRDRILRSVQFAAQELLSTTNWKDIVQDVMAKLGEAADVCRIRVFENRADPAGPGQAVLCHEWAVAPAPDNPPQQMCPNANGHEFSAWAEQLKDGETIAANLSQLDGVSRNLLADRHIKSLIASPIMVERGWWGILTLADGRREREWTAAERDSIRAVADMLGATITRQRAKQALIEANENLEQRVSERTKELREQVVAKEKAHTELAQAQRHLIEASRQAGMAEVATGVLHNVGNVLNSVNVSTTLITDGLRKSRLANFVKATQLMAAHQTDLATYLTQDPKGQMLPSYLGDLATHLTGERAKLLREAEMLAKNIEHIKEIVATQQSYAKLGGVLESLAVVTVLEDAFQMNAAAFERHEVEVIRHYEAAPNVLIDKHKVLQILLNLLRNANYAMAEKQAAYAKRLVLGIAANGDNRVKITVEDNGVGIQSDNLTRIFSHGFTTKKNGHGFGLHLGAVSAKEMGGSLTARSDGPGRGAVFTLELPIATHEPTQSRGEPHG